MGSEASSVWDDDDEDDTTAAPPPPSPSLPSCGICAQPKLGWGSKYDPRLDPLTRSPHWHLSHVCVDCFEACQRWSSWTEQDLVNAFDGDPHSVTMAFRLTNRLRHVYNERVRRRRITKDVTQVRRSKLRRPLRHNTLAEIMTLRENGIRRVF